MYIQDEMVFNVGIMYMVRVILSKVSRKYARQFVLVINKFVNKFHYLMFRESKCVKFDETIIVTGQRKKIDSSDRIISQLDNRRMHNLGHFEVIMLL